LRTPAVDIKQSALLDIKQSALASVVLCIYV